MNLVVILCKNDASDEQFTNIQALNREKAAPFKSRLKWSVKFPDSFSFNMASPSPGDLVFSSKYKNLTV
jgi:hypothetical protein